MEDIVDILNVGVEELVRLRYELPRFDHLLRLAYKTRKKTNAGIYASVYDFIPVPTRNQLEELLAVDPETNRSLWNLLRQDPGKVTINRLGAYFLDEFRDAINIDYRLPVVSLSN